MNDTAGLLVVLSVMVPAIAVMAMLARPSRAPDQIAALAWPAVTVVTVTLAWTVIGNGAPVTYAVGGWRPPLGLLLRADGLAVVTMVMVSVILGLVGLAARADPAATSGTGGQRRSLVFWAMLLALWSALNLCVLARDLFTLFVALELLTFAAVPLVALDARAETLRAALRYLLIALAGSGLYLLGVGLVYARHATLDLGLLKTVVSGDDGLAIGLMTAGLMAKTAVFPLHLWLPPAHAGAPAPASAVLSALVVKAPFLLLARIWFELGFNTVTPATHLLAGFGAASILWCSLMALRQARLKLMIAYSTVAQIGYLFLMFPLAPGDDWWAQLGWSGGLLQLTSHAFAKAAMFLAAGLVAEGLGHDRIDGLAGASRAAPLSVFTLAFAGLSLMGLPPSGGFNAKAMMLASAVSLGEWWIAVTILAGGLLAAGYVFRVIGRAIAYPDPSVQVTPIARNRELVPFALALFALALGFVPLGQFSVLAIGVAP
jgi:formate hydrogenlyase subunit 3/multisubunit Na+/H+ antiporter MnhD subunit